MKFTLQHLFDFVDLAGRSTYASGKPPEFTSERRGFKEYTFAKGPWSYRDSYAGFTRSAGQEVVSFDGEIVWSNSYCGGMTAGKEQLAKETFTFLKQALSQDEGAFQSLRGPERYTVDDWEYSTLRKGPSTTFLVTKKSAFRVKKYSFTVLLEG